MLPDLIDKVDSFEVVRDKVAAILASETASQQALAIAAGKDPTLWAFKVYSELAMPWEAWNASDQDVDLTPLVAVSIDRQSFDRKAGNAIERQRNLVQIHIDCYGAGVSRAVDAGHERGDYAAAMACHRIVRLVRNILMAAEYTYLGLPRGSAWDRHVSGVEHLQVPTERSAVAVVAARISFEVKCNELSPQITGEALELISTQITRQEDGLVLLAADFDTTPPDP